MVRKKRNVVLLFAICVSIFLSGVIDVPVLAQGMFDGDLTYEEGAVDHITPEMLALEQQKLNSLYRNRIVYPSSIKISVTQFPQQNGYYCGPATVKQVVHWINGSSNDQDWYAEKLGTSTAGTNMTCIPDVLNDCIDEQFYVYSSIGTQTEWMDKIRSSVYNDRPAVLDINTSNLSDKFPYGVEGHFVNVSGYSSTQVRITDPFDTRDFDDESENKKGNVWYDIDVLYSANSAHFRQAIVW